jgi:protein TonB
MNYPTKAKAKNIQGKVYVNFVIGKEGEIRDVKVLNNVHPLLDSEALRVVNKMPNWSPGLEDGTPVSVSYNLPINFKLRNR